MTKYKENAAPDQVPPDFVGRRTEQEIRDDHRRFIRDFGHNDYLEACREHNVAPLFPEALPSTWCRLPQPDAALLASLAASARIAGNFVTFSAAPAAEPAAEDELTILRARSFDFGKEARFVAAVGRRARQRDPDYTPDPDAHDAPPVAYEAPLEDHDAPMLTKVWVPDADGEWECSQYDKAWLFQLDRIPVSSLPTLAEALERVATDEHACIIRGEHNGTWFERDARLVRRTNLKKPDVPAFFIEVPRRWLMIDVDSAKLPAGMDPLDVEAQARYVRAELLPEGFRGRTCWAQLTGSAGSPKTLRLGLIKLRLAFWLSREINSDEAKLWLENAEGVDLALFRTVQVHYVAPPDFEGGEDFLKGRPRSCVLDGADVASVPGELKVELIDVSNIDVSKVKLLTGDFQPVFQRLVEEAIGARDGANKGQVNNVMYRLACRAIEHDDFDQARVVELADKLYEAMGGYEKGVESLRATANSAWNNRDNTIAEFEARRQKLPAARRDSLQAEWIKDGDGKKIKTSLLNVEIAFCLAGVTVRENEFTRQIEVTGYDEAGLGDLDRRALACLQGVSQDLGLYASMDTIRAGIDRVARLNRYHPVKDYFDSLEHDGTPRLARLIPDYLKGPDNVYAHELGAIFLCAMVTRVYRPGALFQLVPVLEGLENLRKSTALMRLLPVTGGGPDPEVNPYFTDSLLLAELKDAKVAMEKTTGKLMVEFAELGGIHTMRDWNELKGAISRWGDKGRLAYAPEAEDRARQFVLAATYNPKAAGVTPKYARERQGARRLAPVPVSGVIDVDRIIRDRDQLWAEAVAMFKAGRPLYLSPGGQEIQGAMLDERTAETVLDTFVDEAFAGIEEGRVASVDVYKLFMIKPFDPKASELVTEAMAAAGWTKALSKLHFSDGKKRHGFTKGLAVSEWHAEPVDELGKEFRLHQGPPRF